MSISLIIIIITVVASIYAWNNPVIMHKWIFNPVAINQNREYQRFLTSGFIHANSAHLLFNMIAFFFFGANVERVFNSVFHPYGIYVFIIFYLAGIIVSGIPSYIKYKNFPNYNSLGASGGVSALVFSSIMFFPLQPIYILFIPIGIPGFILGALYIVYSYYQGKRMGDNINHDAHLWGALFGVLFTTIAYPPVIPNFIERLTDFSIF